MDGDSTWKQLEIEGDDDIGLDQLGLGALDILFDTCCTSDGKIRVRVCTPPKAGRESTSPTLNSSDCLLNIPTMSHSPSASNLICSSFTRHSNSLDITSTRDLRSNSLSLPLIGADPLEPFIRAGPGTAEYPHDLSVDLHFQPIRDDGTRRLVRIAL